MSNVGLRTRHCSPTELPKTPDEWAGQGLLPTPQICEVFLLYLLYLTQKNLFSLIAYKVLKQIQLCRNHWITPLHNLWMTLTDPRTMLFTSQTLTQPWHNHLSSLMTWFLTLALIDSFSTLLNEFINLRPISPVSIKTANGSCHMMAHYAGDAIVQSFNDKQLSHQMLLPHTLYCPEVLINLISSSRLCDIGATFSATSDRMIYINWLTNEQLHATRRPNSNELWAVCSEDQSTCLHVSTDLIHQRMGHLHSSALRKFCNGSSESPTICTSCSLAKSHRHPISSTVPKADKILYQVHSEIVGPLRTCTPGAKQYLFTFIDKHSRFARIYLLACKDELFKAFVTYLTEAECHTGHWLCILKSDCGGKYNSTYFRAYTATHGIKLEQAPANTPQQNLVSER